MKFLAVVVLLVVCASVQRLHIVLPSADQIITNGDFFTVELEQDVSCCSLSLAQGICNNPSARSSRPPSSPLPCNAMTAVTSPTHSWPVRLSTAASTNSSAPQLGHSQAPHVKGYQRGHSRCGASVPDRRGECFADDNVVKEADRNVRNPG